MALTVMIVVSSFAVAPPAWSEPAIACPPACDRIPNAAWVSTSAIPLDSVYDWPNLAGLAVTSRHPRFRFEDVCATPAASADPRDYAVAEQVAVSNPTGQWQLRAQVLHWRGEAWEAGQLARTAFAAAVEALRNCQKGNPVESASLVVDQPDRFAAAISGPVIMHEYLLADPANSTITELTLWAQAPAQTQWPLVTDTAVLDALGLPLCTAYVDSCS